MTNNLRGWTFEENARDILSQIYQILASCRGGNVTLATMLRIRMTQILDQQPLLIEPSSRVENITEQLRDQGDKSAEFGCEQSTSC
jgi:hypothetical protein